MAITIKKQTNNGKEEFNIVLNNGHTQPLTNIKEKFSLKNEAEALDFVIKSVGYDDIKSKHLTVNGISYKPIDYSS